jgi:predicted house-cleaning noncanonical NTP pyrophosphatase (MazG superfamily)
MGKLVRDRIPDLIRASGREPSIRVLDGEEYRRALHAKLTEESRELQSAAESDRLEEMADVLEVLLALGELDGVGLEEVAERAAEKKLDRGGFSARIWLE